MTESFETLEIESTLLRDSQSRLLLVRDKASDQAFVLKTTYSDRPVKHELLNLKYEYQVAKDLDHPSILRYLSIGPYHQSVAILTESPEMKPLRDYLEEVREQGSLPPLHDFYTVAISLVEGLAYIHRNGVIHKSVSPDNIFFCPTSERVKIHNFSIASKLKLEDQRFSSVSDQQAALEYISPEQSARMNRPLDYRSDLYSVGVTLFEVLTGRTPFPPLDKDDPIALVYSHMTEDPPSPASLREEIPGLLSEVILKLLAKDPIDRYQSCYGLLSDLRDCEQITEGTLAPSGLNVGSHDVSQTFQIPQSLIGRSEHITNILSIFDEVAMGACELVLVGGYSGIGKTSLVNETHKPITRNRGYYSSGKFDQFQRTRPFSALQDALDDLVRSLLKESDDRIAKVRQALTDEIGSRIPILTSFIPKLSHLVGEQSRDREDLGKDIRTQLVSALTDFLKVVATKEHPVVLFLDDVQWADISTLEVIQALTTSDAVHFLMIVCAFRENEVDDSHILNLIVSSIEKERSVHKIVLEPLDYAAAAQIVSGTLHQPTANCQEIARVVYQKTSGNPFHITQILNYLHERGSIYLDYEKGQWAWNSDDLGDIEISPNVVDLLVSRISSLDQETIEVLKAASCIDSRFSLSAVVEATGGRQDAVFSAIWPALASGFLVPLDKDYYVLLTGEGTDQEVVDFQVKFQHDRVQQAAYSLNTEAEKKQFHHKVAMGLIEKSKENQSLPENVIAIAGHLTKALDQITTEAQINEVIRYNIMASERAAESTAMTDAIQFAETAIDILGDNCWQDNHELAFRAHENCVRFAYAKGRLEEVDEYYEKLLANTKDEIQRAYVLSLRIHHFLTRARPDESTRVGLEALACLGIHIKDKDSIFGAVWEFLLLRVRLGFKRFKSLGDLPQVRDPRLRLAHSILPDLGICCNITGHRALLLKVMLRAANLSISHGITAKTSQSLVWLACDMFRVFGRPKWSSDFADASMRIVERFDEPSSTCGAVVLNAVYFYPWSKPWKDAHSLMLKSIDLSNRAGNPFWVAIAAKHLSNFLSINNSLPHDIAETNRFIQLLKESKSVSAHNTGRICRQVLVSLHKGEQHGFDSIDDFSEREHLAFLIEKKEEVNLEIYYICKIFLLFHYDHHEEAFDLVKKAVANEYAISISVFGGLYYFYSYLTITRIHEALSGEDRKFAKSHMRRCERFFKMVNHACQETYSQMIFIMKGEKMRIRGRYTKAISYFRKGMSEANRVQNYRFLGIAYELASQTFFQEGDRLFASQYLDQAIYWYGRWEAHGKVEQLRTRYGLNADDKTERADGDPASAARRPGAPSSFASSYDARSIIEATNSLSEARSFSELLPVLVDIMCKVAGAEKCVLLLKDPETNALRIEAVRSGDRSPKILHSVPWQDSTEIPGLVVRAVVHSREPINLGLACEDRDFEDDPYISENRVRSLICIPISHEGDLAGVIYLENNAASNAFTAERIEVLRALSTQAAISFENAFMYRGLERKIEERTEKLSRINSEMRTMLQNLKQGVFTAGNNLRLYSEYSNHLESIFERQNLGSENLLDLLFTDSDIEDDALSSVRSVLTSSLGEDVLALDLNAHLLPSQYCKYFEGGRNKTLDLDWSPVLNSENIVEKILVSVRDVTKLKALELENLRHDKETKMMAQLMATGSQDIASFFERSDERFESSERALSALRHHWSQDAVYQAYRDIHTVKGLARSKGYDFISNSCHRLEEQLQPLTSSNVVDTTKVSESLTCLRKAREELDTYRRIFEANMIAAPKETKAIVGLFDRLREMMAQPESVLAQDQLASIGRQFVIGAGDIFWYGLSELTCDLDSMVASSASRLGKVPPRIVVLENGVRLDAATRNPLLEILVHCVTNSIDHGIEEERARLASGKSKEGTIYVETSLGEDQILVEVWDDGRGIDLKALARLPHFRETSRDREPDPQSALEALFAEGLSTAEETTELSGRGVGMSAVRSIAKEMGGHAEAKFTDSKKFGQWRSIKTVVTLPRDYALEPLEDAEHHALRSTG